ncbi:MAG TPA: branched-chain amino acid ABC transporter substrate-binding protein [Bacilli bacterium]|nr:branched-chain amino acid ABC transporter substrate-binding protein [Bacilli bacterium]
MFKKITDERLIVKNLKNIRVAYVFQTLGILAILIYEGINKGVSAVTTNPLWLVFIGTGVLFAFMNLGISVDNDETIYEKKQSSYMKTVMICLFVGVLFGCMTSLTPDGSVEQGILLGTVIFISALIPYTIIYFLKKKRIEESE